MDNIVNITLKNYNNSPVISDISSFKSSIYKYKVEYLFKDGKLYITITSKEKLSTIYRHFMIHYKLLFFNNGYFYEIEEYKENNKIKNIKNYSNIEAYITNLEYIKNYRITNIKKIINKETIKKLKKLSKKIY